MTVCALVKATTGTHMPSEGCESATALYSRSLLLRFLSLVCLRCRFLHLYREDTICSDAPKAEAQNALQRSFG